MHTDVAVLATSDTGRRNRVLAGLLAAGQLSEDGFRLVGFRSGDVLHEVGQPIDAVVFPVDCVVSVAMLQDGATVDVTTLGREGLLGLPGLLGATLHDTRAVCRVQGTALLLPVATARQLLAPDSGLSPVLAHYIRATLTVLMQRVVCNRSHSGDQRTACWLLHSQDRVGADRFALTHATLAEMLGVRRATVSESLTDLQRRDVIRSRRGIVTVQDRPALEAASCACYEVLRRAFTPSTG